jgi:hypothetical protein
LSNYFSVHFFSGEAAEVTASGVISCDIADKRIVS